MALLSILVGLGIATLVGEEFHLSTFIVNMMTAMGLALGIDYSLFIISRFREERAGGLEKEKAIQRTAATASRAVLFSGSTFVVALLGMFLVPTNISAQPRRRGGDRGSGLRGRSSDSPSSHAPIGRRSGEFLAIAHRRQARREYRLRRVAGLA